LNANQTNLTWGLLFVGHGTNDPTGTAQFLELAAGLAQRFKTLAVEPAFLELQLPNIDTGVQRLVERGIQQLGIMPLLLFAAGHAKEDVPKAVRQALKRHTDRPIEPIQAAHLGCHPLLVELSHRRMLEAQNAAESQATKDRTCLLLVGRGSKDATATAEMHEFAALRQRLAENLHVEVAFLAMAQPSLAVQLKAIAQQSYSRVIVQPHLLFHGELLDSLRRQVGEMSQNHGQTQWLLAPALADPLNTPRSSAAVDLEKVIEDRCLQAGIPVVARGGDD
jgi:sirohydrochlorin cobaltochelatase